MSTSIIKVIMRKNKIISALEYDKLVDAMLTCADEDNLPQMLEIKNTTGISLADIHEFITSFKEDTLLDIKFSAETCPFCDRLHAFLFVDYPEEDVDPTFMN